VKEDEFKKKPNKSKGIFSSSFRKDRPVRIKYLDTRPPVKSIVFAFFLVVSGAMLFYLTPHSLSIFCFSTLCFLMNYSLLQVLIIVSLMLILPGLYVCILAAFAFWGVDGYTYDLIPGSFDSRY
jgi:hypothetical protein